MAKEDATKALCEATGLIPVQIHTAREQWMNSPAMRLILTAECDRLIEETRAQLETISPDQLKEVQGRLKGIRAIRGVINSQTN